MAAFAHCPLKLEKKQLSNKRWETKRAHKLGGDTNHECHYSLFLFLMTTSDKQTMEILSQTTLRQVSAFANEYGIAESEYHYD